MIGMNVTAPFKELVVPYLDELDKSAEMVGAVNTIINRDGRLIGYNTDGMGFIYSIETECPNFDFLNKKAVIIGAGGAARSIGFALISKGMKLSLIATRSIERAKKLKSEFNSFSSHTCTLDQHIGECDMVIQTSPIGMSPLLDQSPIDDFSWVLNQVVIDIIYNPKETLFLREAKRRGAFILNGISMLAAQGALAFELFTGQTADYRLMKKEVEAFWLV
jgi:shikimate dehydrogenase